MQQSPRTDFSQQLAEMRHAGEAGSLREARLPAIEVLMILKFVSACVRSGSQPDRHYALGDLMAMVRAVGLDELDRELMETLAAQVYPGAEREFVDLLGRIERGEAISI